MPVGNVSMLVCANKTASIDCAIVICVQIITNNIVTDQNIYGTCRITVAGNILEGVSTDKATSKDKAVVNDVIIFTIDVVID